MFHLTFMAGSQVRLKEEDNVIITVWGGTDVLMPTLAEKIMRLREAKRESKTVSSDNLARRTNVITFQGATVFQLPTFAREIEEMIQLRECGMMPDQELLELWQEAASREDFDILDTLTVMAGATEERPSRKQEIEGLHRLVLKGIITSEEYRELKQFIEAKGDADLRVELQERLRQRIVPSAPAGLTGAPRPLPPALLKE